MAGADTSVKTTVHPRAAAFRIDGQGNLEEGELYFIEQTHLAGRLRATYEYNLYYWPESQCWTGDVISPHGWHDISEEEAARIAQACRIREAAMCLQQFPCIRTAIFALA